MIPVRDLCKKFEFVDSECLIVMGNEMFFFVLYVNQTKFPEIFVPVFAPVGLQLFGDGCSLKRSAANKTCDFPPKSVLVFFHQ